MRTRTMFPALFLLGVALSITVLAMPEQQARSNGKSTQPSPLDVTSSVAGTLADPGPFQILSDGGAYPNGGSVLSIMSTASGQDDTNAAGDWELFTISPRTFYLNFDQPVAGTGPGAGTPTFASGYYTGRFVANCDVKGTNLLKMTAGTTAACPLLFEFEPDRTNYQLHMNNGIGTGGTVGSPETDNVTVTCTANGSGASACGSWTFEPSGVHLVNGVMTDCNEARLSLVEIHGNTQTLVDLGDFYFSFQFTVTYP